MIRSLASILDKAVCVMCASLKTLFVKAILFGFLFSMNVFLSILCHVFVCSRVGLICVNVVQPYSFGVEP